MAKQIGEIKITGTVEDITFYKMDGEYYARMKSSLTGKKFWNNKAFEGSRRSCSRFAEGNKLASRIYRMIEEEKRIYKLYCFLKKKAIQLLKEEKTIEETEKILMDYLVEFGIIEREEQIDREENTCSKNFAANACYFLVQTDLPCNESQPLIACCRLQEQNSTDRLAN